MNGVMYPRSQEEIDKVLEVIERASKKITKSKATARAYLIKYGFVTKSGKLTKRYGG